MFTYLLLFCFEQIFDADFNEYVLLDENSAIHNLSKVRLYLPNSDSGKIENKIECSKVNATPIDTNTLADETKTISNPLLFDDIHERSTSPKFLSFPSNTGFEQKGIKFLKNSNSNSNTCLVSPSGSSLLDSNQNAHELSTLNNNDLLFFNNDTFSSSESCNSTRSEAGSENVLGSSNQSKSNQLCLNQCKDSNSLQSDQTLATPFLTSDPARLHSKALLLPESHSSNTFQSVNQASLLTNNQRSKNFSIIPSNNDQASRNNFNSKSKNEDEKKEARLLIQDFGKILYDTDFHISSLDEKIKIIRNLQKYRERFVCASTKIDVWNCDEIWDKINTDLVSQGIDVDIKSEFAQLLSQYTDIITYLAGWSEEDCQKLWPLFSIFHHELSLTPFNPKIDNLIYNFDSKSKDKASTSFDKMKNQVNEKKKKIAENNKKTTCVQIKKAKDLKNLKLFLTTFTIKRLEEKKLIVDTICKHFLSLNYNHKKPKPFFDAISRIINAKHKNLHLKPQSIKNAFEGLLGQYVAILKHLTNWSSKDCQQLWPFFNTFHFDFDVNQYKSFASLQNHFNKHPKINAGKLYGHLFKSKKLSGEDLLQIEDLKLNENDLSEKEKRLLQVVFKNSNDSIKNCSEKDFWKKIAYEMSNYESPLKQSSQVGWKTTFYSLLDSYITEINSDVIGKCRKNNHLFQNQDLSPFLIKFARNNLIDKQVNKFPQIEWYDQKDRSKHRVQKASSKKSTVHLSHSQNSDCDEQIPDYLKHQYTFIKIIKNHLNYSGKPKKFWKRVYSEITTSGYNLNPNIDLREYFKCMLQVYLQVMRVSDNFFTAINVWPFFRSLNELDLSPFVDNAQEYYQLKSKFVTK